MPVKHQPLVGCVLSELQRYHRVSLLSLFSLQILEVLQLHALWIKIKLMKKSLNKKINLKSNILSVYQNCKKRNASLSTVRGMFFNSCHRLNFSLTSICTRAKRLGNYRGVLCDIEITQQF